MADSLKIYFCDICNESIPLKDLETGSAITIKGKMLCASCNPQSAALTPSAPTGSDTQRTLATSNASSASSFSAILGFLGFAAAAAAITMVILLQEQTKRGLAEIAKLNSQSRQMQHDLGSLDSSLEQERKDAVQTLRIELQDDMEKERLSQEKRFAEISEKLEGILNSTASLDSVASRLGKIEGWSENAKQDLASLQNSLDSMRVDLASMQESVAAIPEEKPMESASAKEPAVPGWEQILERLNHSDPGVRWNAVIDIGNTGDPRAIPYLIPMLQDTDVFVRNNVAQTLGELEAMEAVPALIETLNDPEHFVRDSVHNALVRITGEKSIKFDPMSRSKEERTRVIKAWQKWWEQREETPQ